MGVCGKMTGE